MSRLQERRDVVGGDSEAALASSVSHISRSAVAHIHRTLAAPGEQGMETISAEALLLLTGTPCRTTMPGAAMQPTMLAEPVLRQPSLPRLEVPCQQHTESA